MEKNNNDLERAKYLLIKVLRERHSRKKTPILEYDLLTQEIDLFLQSSSKVEVKKNRYRQTTLEEQIKRITNG